MSLSHMRARTKNRLKLITKVAILPRVAVLLGFEYQVYLHWNNSFNPQQILMGLRVILKKAYLLCH